MYQRRPKRFRRRSNDRGYQPRRKGDMQVRLGSNSFSNGHKRNYFHNSQNAEKLIEKYNALAKEALSSGDKTLYENYLQHADHFIRMVEDKNKNQNKAQIIDKPALENKNLSENNTIDEDKSTTEKKE